MNIVKIKDVDLQRKAVGFGFKEIDIPTMGNIVRVEDMESKTQQLLLTVMGADLNVGESYYDPMTEIWVLAFGL